MLSFSYKKCSEIGKRDSYTDAELETIDALTSRFARASDILTQRIFGLIDEIELEERGTFLDRIHRAEKREIVQSSDVLKEIREMRNHIAHEYTTENGAVLLSTILRLSSSLIEIIRRTELYVGKYVGSV